MKKIIIISLFIFINISHVNSKALGETEITAEDGIEVFQKEKYYLLKKNVKIISDNLNLSADLVRAYFDKDLYDITNIYAEGSVVLNADDKGVKAKGNIIEFTINDENIKINGINSELILEEVSMFSNGTIDVNNIDGTFLLKGTKSKMISGDINVYGEYIEGKFSNQNEIINLNVEDKKLSNIKTNDTNMFAVRAIYDKKNNIIELKEKVKVIRGNETITGDYGFVDIENNSYKVTSDNSKKVKILISQSDE